MQLPELIQLQNKFLKEFLRESDQFLLDRDHHSLESFNLFQQRTNQSLQAYEKLNQTIEIKIGKMTPEEKTPNLVESIRPLLQEKEDLIRSILTINSNLMVWMETEKKRLYETIQSSRKTQESMSKFRSRWVHSSGEHLDGKL